MTNGRYALAAAAILAGAFAVRAHDLTLRAYHHDEAIHGYGSFRIACVYRGLSHDHAYNPIYHGPLMYHVTSVAFALFGDSDATGRSVPLAFGLIAVALPIVLRRELGDTASLLGALLLGASPIQIYFSRFLREDAFMAAFTLGFYGLFWRGKRERRTLPGLCAIALLGFCFLTKESSYIVALVFASSVCLMGTFVVACRVGGLRGLVRARGIARSRLVLGHVSDVLLEHAGMVQGLFALFGFAVFCLVGALTVAWDREYRALAAAIIAAAVAGGAAGHLIHHVRGAPDRELEVAWATMRGPLLGIAVFAAIFVGGFTNALTFPDRLGSGLFSSLEYWTGQQKTPRLDGPFLYHAVVLLLHDPVVFLLPIAVALAWAGWLRRAVVWLAGTATLGVLLIGEHSVVTGALDRAVRALLGGRGPLDVFVALTLGWLFVRSAYRAHLERDTALAFSWLWALHAFLLYAWAREKVPWLTVHVAMPFSLLTALLLRKARPPARAAVVGLALLLAAHSRWLTLRSGECDTVDPITYVQTLPSVPAECARIEALTLDVPEGLPPREVLIQNDVTVPFYWYLRRQRTLYSDAIGVPEPGQLVLAERGKEGEAGKLGLRKRRIQFYGWHVPEWGRTGMGLEGIGELLDWLPPYLVWRESAPFRSGGMEALLFVTELPGAAPTGETEPAPSPEP